jgi:hypothetical protein
MRLLSALALTCFGAASLEAQICSGNASFAGGPLRVGASASFAKGARSFGGDIAAGMGVGPYARAGMSMVNFDDATRPVLGVLAGMSIPANKAHRLGICPIVSYMRQGGPDFDDPLYGRVKQIFTNVGFGMSVGGIIASSPAREVLPFASASFVAARTRFEFGGSSRTASENFFDLTGGVGFVFRRVVSLRPALSLAIGTGEADPILSLSVGRHFGGVSANR